MVFTGYGALLGRALAGSESVRARKLGGITSGIGLLLILVAGFGLIAKMGYSYAAPWIVVKMLVWLALGGMIALINRKPDKAGLLWWVTLALGILAAVMVYLRPGS